VFELIIVYKVFVFLPSSTSGFSIPSSKQSVFGSEEQLGKLTKRPSK